ncbi:NADP-dependent oxidoreductase [Thermobispora bispora]|uniref:NADP-dependent oxidoreductase n=1 Tax=Thermobispora bispora TaxID=2006 RepID=UPI00197E402A|nr:NADP-dependent oxidoreductase [Thermobispora bispora]QSI49088.1 NADP-dependent oxidoreductase [Thermobispora bispora]
MKTRQVLLAARPTGWPRPDDFAVAEAELPEPADGRFLVRNVFMSVDPYMRGRMNAGKSYVPPFQVGEPLTGGAIGEVLESKAPGFAPGDLVLHDFGWREHAVLDAAAARKVPRIPGVSPSAYLGVLGMPGLTAYVGLLDIAGMKEGDVVFVSAAAGAVGSLAGQLARLKGASRVIGSVGSDEKVAHVTGELGFDAAFNYRRGPVRDLLKEAAPDGIDVYFDNVGADHLEAAIAALRPYGRVAMCGAIAVYNATEPPPGPRNLVQAIGKRLTLRGFIVSDHYDRFPAFLDEVGPLVRDGKIVHRETVAEGLDQAPEAFLAMLRGENIGKMIVRL